MIDIFKNGDRKTKVRVVACFVPILILAIIENTAELVCSATSWAGTKLWHYMDYGTFKPRNLWGKKPYCPEKV